MHGSDLAGQATVSLTSCSSGSPPVQQSRKYIHHRDDGEAVNHSLDSPPSVARTHVRNEPPNATPTVVHVGMAKPKAPTSGLTNAPRW
jgi:hypothetical protein